MHVHRIKMEPRFTAKDFPVSGKIGSPGIPYVPKKDDRPLLIGSWEVNYKVDDVAGLSLEQADGVILSCRMGRKRECMEDWFDFRPRVLVADITYPLDRGVRVTVRPFLWMRVHCPDCDGTKPLRQPKSEGMSPGYFLWVIATQYKRIYKESGKYGVWGHHMSDLGFEAITIGRNGVARVDIGS